MLLCLLDALSYMRDRIVSLQIFERNKCEETTSLVSYREATGGAVKLRRETEQNSEGT